MHGSAKKLWIVVTLLAPALAGCDDEAPPPADDTGIADVLVADAKVCVAPTSKCGSSCVNLQTSAAHCGACDAKCPAGKVCAAGKCTITCPSQQTKCGGGDAGAPFCSNLQTDSNNCGACGNACQVGEVCSGGKCVLSCPPKQQKCGGGDWGAPFCANLQTDGKNCGACGNSCQSGQICAAGKCSLSCPAKQTKCGGGDAGVPYCANLNTDTGNCGACGTACKAGEVCTAGKCVLSCQAGKTNCSGVCVNLDNDLSNCGKCGHACKAGEVCSKRICALSCQTGLTDCSGTCVNLQTDNNNCGTCSNACKAGHVCAAGACKLSCQTGLTNCSGTCVNLKADLKNCGACGNACKAGYVCASGACALWCQAGKTSCGGSCVDLKTDNNNCGACATKCKLGQVCASGACSLSCGNGVIDAGEQCDGAKLAGKTCVALGYYSGTLACSKTCAFDVTGCHRCGDGVLNGTEQCDGKQLGSKTCKTQGFDGGTLACAKTGCTFDTTGCGKCTDKKKNGDETDVDCGGSCSGCAAGKACSKTPDCAAGTLCKGGKCVYAASCKELHAAGNKTNGEYTIDPNGGSAADAYKVRCDMTTSGGGWTLVASFINTDSKNSWTRPTGYGNWTNTATLGSLATYTSADFKSKAYSQLTIKDLMLTDETGGWLSYTGVLSSTTMRAQMASYSKCQTSPLVKPGDSRVKSSSAIYQQAAMLTFYAGDPNRSSHCAFSGSHSDSTMLAIGGHGCGTIGAGQWGTNYNSGMDWHANLQNSSACVACDACKAWYGHKVATSKNHSNNKGAHDSSKRGYLWVR